LCVYIVNPIVGFHPISLSFPNRPFHKYSDALPTIFQRVEPPTNDRPTPTIFAGLRQKPRLAPSETQQASPTMTAPSAGCSTWGPSPQHLSLQVTFPCPTTCSNIRYMFTGCLHILLLRCPIHPVSQATGDYGSPSNTSSKTLFNTCPDPQATFSAIEAPGSCPLCAEQAVTRLRLLNLEAHIARLQADIKECRNNRGGSRTSLSPFSMKSEIAKAELQRAKEAHRSLNRSFDPCGGGPGMDSLGLRATYEPGRFREVVADSCSWTACPEDQLWGWDL
jgi:hypothetical protein